MNEIIAMQGTPSVSIILVHGFDPRGMKVGGLETYCRDFIRHCPPDCTVTLVGVDSFGDLELGVPCRLRLNDVDFAFLPVARYGEDRMTAAATDVGRSLTFQFVSGLWKYRRQINLSAKQSASFDLRRVEASWLPILLRRPFVQMLHGEGVPRQRMDSLLQKYRFVHGVMEAVAIAGCAAFYCVTEHVAERTRRAYPWFARKVGTLTTWADPKVFTVATPIEHRPFRVVFCGRLDTVKRPDLIFRITAQLAATIERPVELHLVGSSDAERFSEYDAIRDKVTAYGARPAAEVHRIIADCDCGILTSEFEGMPRFVLEALSTGRPVVAAELPQLRAVIEDEVSGYLVDRGAGEQDLVSNMVQKLARIAGGDVTFDPQRVASKVSGFRPDALLSIAYDCHRKLAARHRGAA